VIQINPSLSESQIDTDYWISQNFNSNKQGMNLVVEHRGAETTTGLKSFALSPLRLVTSMCGY
jgi:hypothetical protein